MEAEHPGGSTYDIEFLHRDSEGSTLVLDVIRIIGNRRDRIIVRAEEMFLKMGFVPRPNGYRVLGAGGEIVHEYWKQGS
jgi:hypothetical protein